MSKYDSEERGGGGFWIAVGVVVLTVFASCVWLIGASNPETPAGYVGYLTKGALFGQTRFVGLQTGPTSPGREWLLDVHNVSVTPYTYTEAFEAEKGTAVLAHDNLLVGFNVHIVWRARAEGVKELVERFSTLGEGSVVETAYGNFVREPLRTAARDEIQRRNGLEIKDQIQEIGTALFNRAQALVNDTPFEVLSVVVGNIQYPKTVADAVSEKLSTTQVLERKQIEIQVEEAEAKKRIVQAEGIARAMEVIQLKLTPLYLQHEAIEAQRLMVGSPNHSAIYIPVGPMGVPIVKVAP